MMGCFQINGKRAAVLIAAMAVAAAAPGRDDPGSVRAQIRQRGARAVVQALVREGRWDALMKRVASGEPAYVSLAPLLRAGTDAGPGEDLTIGLATALPANPAGVLRISAAQSDGSLGIARVCSAPFIEQPPGATAAYRARAIASVGAMSRPALAQARDKCLSVLQHGPV